MTKDKKKAGLSTNRIAFIMIIVVVSIVLLYGAFIIWKTWPISEWSVGKSGVFGDSFGIVTALFSGLAFAGLIWAILVQRDELRLQREDLALQREELTLTREELRGQKDQLRNQNETMQRQTFENTFFQMLSLYNEIVDSLNYPIVRAEDIKGRRVFFLMYDALRKHMGQAKQKVLSEDENDIIRFAFEQSFNIYEQFLGHCFKYLTSIIKFVDEKGPEDYQEKILYVDLITAQLSIHENLVLFYYALSPLGYDLKQLIENYAFFKGLPQTMLFDPSHSTCYEKSAF